MAQKKITPPAPTPQQQGHAVISDATVGAQISALAERISQLEHEGEAADLISDSILALINRVALLEQAPASIDARLSAKLEYLERRIKTLEAADSAEPITTTLEAKPDTQFADLAHKVKLLNDSIGAY